MQTRFNLPSLLCSLQFFGWHFFLRAARAGDPPSLVAHAERIRSAFGWTPRFDDLRTIVRTQLEWERRLLREPA